MSFDLSLPKTIVIIGLSDNPKKPSFQVAKYLIEKGFTIIPVNPTITQVFGLKSYPSISLIPQEIKIDIVDIFRKSDQILLIIEEIIKLRQRPIIWLQEGISNLKAEVLAKNNGLEVISGICLMKAHKSKGI